MMKKITQKFPGKQVLVVDDFAMNQEFTTGMLELMACKVSTATSGKQALELYQKGRYDIVLLDVMMPEMDGYEVTRRIRAMDGKQRHTPIIAITANALSGDRERCLKAGMDDYVSKPLRGADLEELLSRYLAA